MKDQVNPPHYKTYPKECIEMMVDIFGRDAVINYCYCNAFKYRMRAGLKPGQPAELDYEKERWYLDKAEELSAKEDDSYINTELLGGGTIYSEMTAKR